MAAKKQRILEQNQDFEGVLADEYRRESGVPESFAKEFLKLNRVGAPAARKKTSGSTRKLAKRLLLKK